MKIRTWARSANRFFTYRDFEIYVKDKLVAVATSKWALVDIEKRKIGGLGIFLVKEMMDEVSYEYADGKNILKLKKNL